MIQLTQVTQRVSPARMEGLRWRALVIAVLISFFITTTAAAQPTGYQEYYVLGYEEQVWRAFLAIYDGPDRDIPGRMCSTVSLVATADYQVIYYDHWEDGYEANLLNPVQPTTEVYGDGDLSNGGTGNDILLAGDDLNLTSARNVTGPTAITGYVPVNPVRDPAYLRYDGGDRVISSGGPVDLAHAMWPLNNSWVGSAWEVYSRQAYADTYSYRLPIGEDLYEFGGGATGIYGDFRNVYLQLEAFEDNTTVSLDNGTTIVNLTLDRGQTYSSMGYVNSAPAPAITVNTGTTIRSNRPTQVGLITGSDSRDGFQGRSPIVLSDQLWGADYIVPVPSGNPGDEAEIYLSNPNDFPISIRAYDRQVQTTFVISPTGYISATVPYSEKRGGYIPADSAARFTSPDGTFGIVVCADTLDTAYAWGFSAIPSKYLTRDYYVSWAPGSYNVPPTENGSPVWVTPLADDTTFHVDFSPLDGVVDETFTLDVLEQRRIFDPDNDNTGMHVWATSEFAIVWGEDPRTAGTSNPYLDMGIITLPLQQRWLDPVLTLDKTADPTILPTTGGVVTFTLATQAYNAPLVNVDITDTLPIRWTYVPGSTHVHYPNGSTGNPEPTLADQTLFWNLSTDLGLNQSLTLTFQAQLTDTTGITVSVNQGEAVGKYEYAGVLFNPSDEATVGISPLSLIKSVNSAQAHIGDTLVYTLSYANLSDSIAGPDVTLYDAVPIQHLTFQSASAGGVYNGTSGAITWALDTLAPGASGSVTFTAKVNDFVEDGILIENVAYIASDRMMLAGSNVARTTVLAPKIEFTKLGPTVAGRGHVITYTLYYNNAGQAQATGVTIQDTTPVSATYIPGSLSLNTGSGWVWLTDAVDGDPGAYISPTLVVTPATIAAGAGGQVRFSVRLDDDLPPGSLIQNWATLDRDLDIPRESNLAVTRISDLLIRKAAEQAEVAPGGIISYKLTYENVSRTIPQTEVYVREPIPGYTSLIPGTAYGGDRIEYSWDNGANWSSTLPITPVTHIRWYDAVVPTSTQATVGFVVQAATTLPLDTTIRNIAHISSTQTATYFREWVPSNQVEVATTAARFATIYGSVFEDTNVDGIRDAGEVGISNVTVTLDGTITTTTAPNGNYTFSTTVAGMHTIIETDHAVYTSTTSAVEYADPGNVPNASEFAPFGLKTDLPGYFSTTPNEVHINVILGSSYRVDFGDMLTNAGLASIYGTVFNDTNGNGVWDMGELGIPDVLVTLDGVVTTTTDLNGNYTFPITIAGPHTVVETDPSGHFSTTPNEVHVKVVLGNGYQVRFGDTRLSSGFATIYGTVFEDADGDRMWDMAEPGIPGALVTLDGAITTTTNLNGNYTFSTPVPGAHTLVETDPFDYSSTTPNEMHVDVILGQGYQVNFGDTRAHGCSPDFYEEDDTATQAATFVVGTSQAHQFCDDATDWAKFAARASTVYTITAFSWGQRADTFLALFDTDGQTLLAANDDYEGTTDYSSRVVWQAPADGVYYVRVTNRGELFGLGTDYDLVIKGGGASVIIYLPIVVRNSGGEAGVNGRDTMLHPTGIIDHACPDPYEPDDTWQQAHSIDVRVVQTHSFDSDPAIYVADKDFVRFDVSTGEAVVFAISPVTNTQTLMDVYDEHGAALASTEASRLVWIPTTSGRHYLSVSPQDNSASFGCTDTVGYNLSMETVETNRLYLPLVMRNS